MISKKKKKKKKKRRSHGIGTHKRVKLTAVYGIRKKERKQECNVSECECV
jgi:hypothetical protein